MEIVDLQYIPGSAGPVVHVSQMDVGRQFKIRLFDGENLFTLPNGTTASIDGKKPDNTVFSYNDAISVSGNEFTITTKLQMTIISGLVECEIRFKKPNHDTGTLNFKMMVEPSPVNEEADMSESDLPDIIALAEEQMLTAEAYARGTRNGVPVSSGQAGYNDNSKYWKEQTQQYVSQAQTAATNAANSATAAAGSATTATNKATDATNQALKSEGYASGKQNNVDVPSTSPYYHNNAKYYAEIAGQYSVNVPYIGPNGNWWVWSTTTSSYVDSGVDASITVQIADITMLAPTATPYVTNTGTDTDPIFHLFIPRGKGIASIEKTNTNVLVDTYTITYSDGATTTFTVTNGRGINTISKTGSSGLDDTYTIAYNDGTTTTFVVTNGKTAYQSAVEGGYTGTEAQFEADLGNFKAWRDDAVQAASDAQDSADDAADSETNAHQSYLDAKTEADRAQAYANFLEPHFVIADNQLCIKNDAIGEFIVADNRLCMKLIA